MGAWGDGIFECDQSLDYAWTVIENLINEVQSGLYLLVARQDDFYAAEYRITPAIRFIQLILQETNMKPPDSHVIKKWKQIYIDNLNPSRIECGDEPIPQDDKCYLNHIEAFDDLIQFAEDWEKGYQEKIAKNKKQKEE